MKKISPKFFLPFVLAFAISCDDPVTVVTDIIHTDGSVTRKIEMRNSKNKFEKSDIQVPFDSTWVVTDSCEIGDKGDTTWIKRAEKLFKNVAEINSVYQGDSSVNGRFSRHANFEKKFRWFNTEYRFAEIVDERVKSDHHLYDFLNKEELNYFYAPDYLKFSRERGPDSTRYKQIADSVEKKTDKWGLLVFSEIWTREFARLTNGKIWSDSDTGSINSAEKKTVEIIRENLDKLDSLWSAGALQKKILGDSLGIEFRTEADSAFSLTMNEFLTDFRNYSVRIVMPGKLTGTNGYVDSTMTLLWPVNSDLFMTDPYEMWAESKTTNIWAWIISGGFLVFVIRGIIIRKKSRLAAGPKP